MMLKIKRRWKKRSWFFINSSALAGVFLIQFSYVILRAGNISVTFGHVRESVSEIFCLFSWFLIFEKKIKWMCSKLTNRWADWVPVREWPNRVAIIRWRRKWVSIRLPISIWVSQFYDQNYFFLLAFSNRKGVDQVQIKLYVSLFYLKPNLKTEPTFKNVIRTPIKAPHLRITNKQLGLNKLHGLAVCVLILDSQEGIAI